jgi:hypothetical protein
MFLEAPVYQRLNGAHGMAQNRDTAAEGAVDVYPDGFHVSSLDALH